MNFRKWVYKNKNYMENMINQYVKLEKNELLREKIKLQSKIINRKDRESKLPTMVTVYVTIILAMITFSTNILFKKVDVLNNYINIFKNSGGNFGELRKPIEGIQETISSYGNSMNGELFFWLVILVGAVFGIYELINITFYYLRVPYERKLQCVDIILDNFDIMHESNKTNTQDIISNSYENSMMKIVEKELIEEYKDKLKKVEEDNYRKQIDKYKDELRKKLSTDLKNNNDNINTLVKVAIDEDDDER